MGVAGFFQRFADGADAAVHHVTGRHHVGAGVGVRQGLQHQRVHGFVVHHVTAVVHQAVLAMGGVGIQRHVGDDAQLGEALLERADGALGQAVLVPGRGGVERLGLGRGDREQHDGRDLQRHRLFGRAQQLIDGQPLHAGHGRHGGAAL